jgi:glycosyltransferase involved in cell wall biosynthesis
VPVILSAVDGLELLGARDRAVTVPPGDPAALAHTLRVVLEGRANVDLEAARAYALAHTPERVARIYAGDYAALFEQRAVAAPRLAA